MSDTRTRQPAVCRDASRWQIAGTGSRELALAPPSRKHALLAWISDHIRPYAHHRPTVVRTGAAEGFDAAIATAAADLRDHEHLPIHVVALLPSHDYGEHYWRRSVTGSDRTTAYRRMLARCDVTAAVADDHPHRVRNHVRNETLVDGADLLLSADPTSAGTRHTLQRADTLGVPTRTADDDLDRLRRARGDLWELPADLRAVTTNGATTRDGRAVMGAGVARQAAERDPDLPDRLAAAIAARGNHVAALGVGHDGVELASFPVKHHWRDRADPQLIARSAAELRGLADDAGYQRILLPLPGCGNGGLTWAAVWPLLEDTFDARFTLVSGDAAA